MENKNTKTDYEEVVRVGDQKWEMVEITITIIFWFVWDSYSLFFIYVGNVQVPPEKNHPDPKCQFPPKIPIWPKSLLYKPSENGSISPPSPRRDANYKIPMDMSMHIFNCIKTAEAIILKCLQGHR